MSNRSKFDIPAANECAECHGQGYTHATAQLGRVINGVYKTTAQGSGCPCCGGSGRLTGDAT